MTPRLLTGTCDGFAATVRVEEDAGYQWLRVSYGLTQVSFELPELRVLELRPVPGRGLLGYTGLQCAALVIGGVIAIAMKRYLLGLACAGLGLGWLAYRFSKPKQALVVRDAQRELVIYMDDNAVEPARDLVHSRGAMRAELPAAKLER